MRDPLWRCPECHRRMDGDRCSTCGHIPDEWPLTRTFAVAIVVACLVAGAMATWMVLVAKGQ